MSCVLRSLTAALIIGIGLSAMPPASAQPSPGSKTRSDTVDFSPTGTVEIYNHTGSITVATWDRAQVGYEMTLAPSDSDSVVAVPPAVHRSDRELSFGHDSGWSLNIPGLLTISTGGPDEPVGHFRIVMPETAALEVGDHASTIEVSDVQGAVDLDTHQGTARVHDVDGPLTVDTHAGSAEATGLRKGATLDTHEGRITASFDDVTAPISVDTHSGTVRLFLPPDAGFELQLDLDEEDLTVDEAFGTPTSSGDEHRAFNGSGPPIELDSFSGTVEVRPLKAKASPSP
jgi:hypothetical protein